MNWQPIETAPKDGTKFLVWTHQEEIELSEWFWCRPFHYDHVEGDLYRRIEDLPIGAWNSNGFTHWMPLPKPPK